MACRTGSRTGGARRSARRRVVHLEWRRARLERDARQFRLAIRGDRRPWRTVSFRGTRRRARRYLHKKAAAALAGQRPRLVDLLQRSNAVGPYLVMTPQGAAKFEYFDSSGGAFTPYVHAAAASAAARAGGGTWRLPVSNLRLEPQGKAGARVSYSFHFQWA